MQAHLDWKSISDNIEEIKTNVANRNSNADPDRVVQLYSQWRSLQTKAEDLRTERNANAKSMKVQLLPPALVDTPQNTTSSCKIAVITQMLGLRPLYKQALLQS